ncbi:hypothetical protein ACQY0O_005421 [Thecaphora frezii]
MACRHCSRQLGVPAATLRSYHARRIAASSSWAAPLRGFATTASSSSSTSSSSSAPRSPPPQSPRRSNDKWSRHRTQYNYDPFTLHPSESHLGYPLVTAAELASHTTRPRCVRMLARDFIHDSLYNPHYGYFSKQAVLLPESQRAFFDASSSYSSSTTTTMDRPERFDFGAMRNEADFMRAVQRRYMDFEERVEKVVDARHREREEKERADEAESLALLERRERRERRRASNSGGGAADGTAAAVTPSYSAAGLEAAQQRGRMLARKAQEGVQEREVQTMAAKQVWHTPTQIFQPFYARAIARYLVAEYKLNLYPYDDLVIYELGAGSGALAHDILDYLVVEEPEIYARTRYRISEISKRLAEGQKARLQEHVERGTVEVVNKSFLDWDEDVPEPCFVIALEVLDNLAHDVVRYSTSTLEPYQAIVSIDETGDMHELWEPVSDELIQRYLSLLSSIYPSTRALPIAASRSLLRFVPGWLRSGLANHLPFYPNLTPPHYLPTAQLQMFDTLRRHFPLHRLVVSDFDNLPEACEGIDAPVVQTRFKGTMVPVTTYLVLQGFFDIFFPTNFRTLREVYLRTMAAPPRRAGGEGTAIIPPKSSPLRSDYFTPSLGLALDRAGAERGGMRVTPSQMARSNVKLYSHAEFLERYAETDQVRLQDGSNPMLSWYANASWFLS